MIFIGATLTPGETSVLYSESPAELGSRCSSLAMILFFYRHAVLVSCNFIFSPTHPFFIFRVNPQSSGSFARRLAQEFPMWQVFWTRQGLCFCFVF